DREATAVPALLPLALRHQRGAPYDRSTRGRNRRHLRGCVERKYAPAVNEGARRELALGAGAGAYVRAPGPLHGTAEGEMAGRVAGYPAGLGPFLVGARGRQHDRLVSRSQLPADRIARLHDRNALARQRMLFFGERVEVGDLGQARQATTAATAEADRHEQGGRQYLPQP